MDNPLDLCACGHVLDEHDAGGGECLIRDCNCPLFDEQGDPDELYPR